MHDELPAAVDVARGVLWSEIGLVLQAEHHERWTFREDVEETERRRVDATVLVERRDKRDRPRHRAGAAGDQAVMLSTAMKREIEDRVLAEHGGIEIAGVNQQFVLLGLGFD